MSEINIKKNSDSEYTFNFSDHTMTSRYETNTAKKIKLISIGLCSKFYFYILGSALFKFISLMILGDKETNFGLFGFAPVLTSYNSMQNIYTYLGYIIFGIIFHFWFKGKEKKNNLFFEALITIHKKMMNQDKNKTNFQIFLVCFCFATYKEIQNLLYSFGYEPLDYWTFEIIFTFLLMKKYFEVDIYKHHLCTIIMISIICSFLIFIASFFPSSKEGNQYDLVKEQCGDYFYTFIFILAFIFLSFNYSFSTSFSKVLMQIKFISPYILIFFIGLTGLIFSIITSVISYIYTKDDNLIHYFEKIIAISSTWEILRDVLIVAPIFLFSQFMQINFEILTIYYLNPMYCLLLNNIL